jgi:hypothetical protein
MGIRPFAGHDDKRSNCALYSNHVKNPVGTINFFSVMLAVLRYCPGSTVPRCPLSPLLFHVLSAICTEEDETTRQANKNQKPLIYSYTFKKVFLVPSFKKVFLIKRRTEARLAQLRQEGQERGQEIAKESNEEDSEDEGPPPCVVCLRRQVYWTVCGRLSCVLLFLLLLHCLNLIPCLRPRRNTRQFKAPRQATEKGTTIVGVGHRKDNAEWGKRMEKTLAQMDKRKEAKQTKARVPQLRSLSEQEANEMAQTGDVTNWSSDSDGDTLPIKDTIQTKTIVDEAVIHKDVGMKIARDFGKKGVFLGEEVVAVEYDRCRQE